MTSVVSIGTGSSRAEIYAALDFRGPSEWVQCSLALSLARSSPPSYRMNPILTTQPVSMMHFKLRILSSSPSRNICTVDSNLKDLRGSLDAGSASPLLKAEWITPQEIVELLVAASKGAREVVPRALIEYFGLSSRDRSIFLLLLIGNTSHQHLGILDASADLCEGLQSHVKSNTGIFCVPIDKEEQPGAAIIAIPVSSSGACSIPLTPVEHDALAQHLPSSPLTSRGSFKLKTGALLQLTGLCVVSALLLFLGMSIGLSIHCSPTIYGGEEILTSETLARWEKTHDWSDYYLRLDSGEIARKDLADEKEWRIQAWYQHNVASNATMTVWETGDYLRPERWPTVVNSPQLHFSHCVARVWRYVKAQQTERPACSADTSIEHVLHCIDDILDEFAFPPNASDMNEIEHKPTLLQWSTKFCLD